MAYNSLMVFTGNANPKLAADVAQELNVDLGRAKVGRFSDGEISVELQEHVRGTDVFVLQSTCDPCNDNLMELLVIVDALKRASAGRITAAIPYFGYARQDRRSRSSRVPIAAKLVANMLVASGVHRVLTMDLHAEQIQGFFDIPVDNIYSLPILLEDILKQNYEDPMVVSPDLGGVVRARSLAKRLECDLAIIDKRRPKANVSEVMNIIGEVEGRTCIIMDDMVDTAGTLCKAATALKEQRCQARSSPTVRTRCCRVRRSTASMPPISTPWSSPTPFRCAMAPPPRRASASCRLPGSWPKPSAASATTTPCRHCSSIKFFQPSRSGRGSGNTLEYHHAI